MKSRTKFLALALLICALGLVIQRNDSVLAQLGLSAPDTTRQQSLPPDLPADQVSPAEARFSQSPKSTDPLWSVWVESEKQRYLSLLAKNPCDILVVPVQTLQFGFERAIRSMMTAQLARAVAKSTGKCVVDPYLASLALGEDARQIDPQDLDALSKALHITTLITVNAGPDRAQKKFNFVVRLQQAASAGLLATTDAVRKTWLNIDPGEATPIDKWQDLLPEVLTEIGMKPAASQTAATVSSDLRMPERPEELIAASEGNPLNAALRYQLLAILGPNPGFRQTERLYEKSWLAAYGAGNGIESRRIRARALFHLGYRPAALPLLREDGSAEGRCLVELLNGNLFRAQARAAEITSPVERFLAAMEIRDLSWEYERIKSNEPLSAELQEIAGKSTQWSTLIEARANDSDIWHVADNMSLEELLETSHPIKGMSLASTITGASIMGKVPRDGELSLLPVRHLHKLLVDVVGDFRFASQPKPTILDFLEIIDARALANVEKSAGLALHVQRLPDRALGMLDAYDAEYAGQPHLSLLRAETYEQLSKARMDERVAERHQKAIAAARLTEYWEQGTTPYTQRAEGILPGGGLEFGYLFDYPRRELALDFGYATSDISDLYVAVQHFVKYDNETEKKRLLAILDERFEGHPWAPRLRAFESSKDHDDANEVARMRAEIARDPNNVVLFSALAERLVVIGRYDEAAEVAKSYPGFKQGALENSVALSNYANSVGSLLYWHGAIEPAKELYTLAAGYDNGSEASLVAQQRLFGLAGDYRDYAAVARQRVARYDSPFAARDYLCMLFAMGYSKEAWAAFQETSGRYKNAEVWHAAMVGHRVAGGSDEAVRTWIADGAVRNIRIGSDQPALRFALEYFIVDRTPTADLGKFLATIEGEPKNTVDVYGYSIGHQIENRFYPLGPSLFRKSTREKRKANETVPSPFALFADAYTAQRRGDDAAAVEAFDRLAASYRIELSEMSFVLPYFAMSAAKTGDKLQLQSFLLEHGGKNQFDSELAQAIFNGIARKPDAALENLHRAFQYRPQDGHGQLSAYQYAEVCVWLFDETADKRYIDLALDWARKYQRLDPAFAWAYALEARYSPANDVARTRAIAIADYLDRNSFWLSTISKGDIEKARTWFRANNPFAKPLQTKRTEAI